MTVPDLRARMRRLDALAMGLAREVLVMREAQDPLLRLERQAYIHALREAIRGLESARVALAGAVWRLKPCTRSANLSITHNFPPSTGRRSATLWLYR